jgi:hypothetical protein
MLADFAERPPRQLADGEVLATGRHRLRYLATPHVPHGWDAGHWFDEASVTLFCSDLLFQPGDPEALTEQDPVPAARAAIEVGQQGPLAHDIPYSRATHAALERLAALGPGTLATMHGSSYRGDGGAALRRYAAVLRELLGPS